MSQLPTVTIVICARNAAGHLRRCIPAALAQDYPRDRFKVLVVDNGSEDETAEVAGQLGAVVREFRRPGVAGARQFGWKKSRSEFIAYLDADCEPPTDWLSKAVKHFESDSKLAAVGSRLIAPPPTTLAERHIIESGIMDTDFFFTRHALAWPFVVTAGMVVRRAALESIDGFDLTYGRAAGEDADLCRRMTLAGWTLEYDSSIEIIHHHRSTVRGMLKQVFWYGHGSAAFFARWRKDLGWRRFTDWVPYRRLGWGILYAPGMLIIGRNRYERLRPLLDILECSAYILGKYKGAIEYRVLYF